MRWGRHCKDIESCFRVRVFILGQKQVGNRGFVQELIGQGEENVKRFQMKIQSEYNRVAKERAPDIIRHIFQFINRRNMNVNNFSFDQAQERVDVMNLRGFVYFCRCFQLQDYCQRFKEKNYNKPKVIFHSESTPDFLRSFWRCQNMKRR